MGGAAKRRQVAGRIIQVCPCSWQLDCVPRGFHIPISIPWLDDSN
jgi:hypothetical protein